MAPGGSVCHITSLLPPAAADGGGGLREHIEALQAEAADTTGELVQQRRQREAAARAEREAAAQRERERIFSWDVAPDDEARLLEWFGPEAVEQLRKLWLEGPDGYKKDEVGETEAKEDEKKPEQDARDSDDRGGRGGRGDRGGRGGRGGGRGGRGGGRGGGASGGRDPRVVTTKPILVKEVRSEAHQLVRRVFENRLMSDTTELAPAPSEVKSKPEGGAADDDDERANGKPQVQSIIRIRWSSSSSSSGGRDQRRFDTRRAAPGEAKPEPPPYIHFLLQKTNRDSQDALNILARALGLGRGPSQSQGKMVKELSIAGTKDKRATTVQRVALRRGRRTVDDVWKLINGVGKSASDGGGGRGGGGGGRGGRGGSRFGQQRERGLLEAITTRGDRGLRIGHLSYQPESLHLGQHEGNEFLITLRNVKIEREDDVARAMDVLKTKGFINYFGMQRFGTSSVSTHTVGISLLQSDFRLAVARIMSPRPGDTPYMTEAREHYQAGRIARALDMMPLGNVPERCILQRMKTDAVTGPDDTRADWRAIFSTIPRNLRTMYVHAYQSYIWNRIVTERVRRFGVAAPVVGDVVLVGEEEGEQEGGDEAEGEDDNDDDNNGDPAEEQQGDEEAKQGEADEQGKPRAKPPPPALPKVKLLATQADADQYTIHDVVMPLPGYDVTFPADSWLGQMYASMLAEDGLVPAMVGHSNVPELQLKGAYRKLLHLPRNIEYRLLRYTDTEVALAQTDEEKILGIEQPLAEPFGQEKNASDEGSKGDGDEDKGKGTNDSFVALQLRFTLGTAAYATMALREVLKQDTSVQVQKDLTERGEDRAFRGSGSRGRGRGGGGGGRQEGAALSWRARQAVNEVQAGKGKAMRSWGPSASDTAASSEAKQAGQDAEMASAE